MLSKANWAHSHKELVRVSHSCSHSYSQPHQAITSVVLTVMLTSLLGLFSATTVSWVSFLRVSVPQPAPRCVVAHADRKCEWDHFDSIFGSWNRLLNFQFMFRRFTLWEKGALSHLLQLASRKIPQTYPYTQQNLKNLWAKTTASVNHWLLKVLHQASLFSWLGFSFDTVWIFFYEV